jgi:hypothetical protein
MEVVLMRLEVLACSIPLALNCLAVAKWKAKKFAESFVEVRHQRVLGWQVAGLTGAKAGIRRS